MTCLILRYRDLIIPEGETIRRHRGVIDAKGEVWWGWMKRKKEIFPATVFRDLSMEMSKRPTRSFLFDSNSEQIHEAIISQIYAVPGDNCLTPNPACTPSYMSEAFLAAWFKITSIVNVVIRNPNIRIKSMPTVDENAQLTLLNKGEMQTTEALRLSEATLWIGEVT